MVSVMTIELRLDFEIFQLPLQRELRELCTHELPSPFSRSSSADFIKVPAVSQISSTRMQVLFETSPIIVIELISPGAFLLYLLLLNPRLFFHSSFARDTPPTSGETIVIFLFLAKLCRISMAQGMHRDYLLEYQRNLGFERYVS